MPPTRPGFALSAFISSSVLQPTCIRVPSYRRTSRASVLLATEPAICACIPQELLPSMPPRVQWLWVAGSGPKVRPYFPAAFRRLSRPQPGRTVDVFRVGSMLRICPRYLDQSITMAVLQHGPARLVPPPRDNNGTPNFLQAATVLITSSMDFGMTTPMGT